MILNNYRAIRLISQLKNELLTPDLIFTLHRTITEGTLPEGAEQNKTGSLGSSGVGISCKNSRLQRMSRLARARNQPLSRVLVEESLVNLGNGA